MSKRKCEICEEVLSKYTCPRCQKRTCSLPCVKKHKEQTECDGIRDKTAYVPMKEFTDITLLNDYRFLEEVGRIADNSKRDSRKGKLPRARCAGLIKKVALKRNIKLKYVPYTMMRSKNNTTRLASYFYGDILWHVELVFPEAEVKYTQSRVNENTTIQDLLRGYIHPTESDPVKRQKLKSYSVSGWENYKVFMRKNKTPANNARYYEFDVEKSLVDNLCGKELIEYPILYVVLPKDFHHYPIADEVSTATGTSVKLQDKKHHPKKKIKDKVTNDFIND